MLDCTVSAALCRADAEPQRGHLQEQNRQMRQHKAGRVPSCLLFLHPSEPFVSLAFLSGITALQYVCKISPHSCLQLFESYFYWKRVTLTFTPNAPVRADQRPRKLLAKKKKSPFTCQHCSKNALIMFLSGDLWVAVFFQIASLSNSILNFHPQMDLKQIKRHSSHVVWKTTKYQCQSLP